MPRHIRKMPSSARLRLKGCRRCGNFYRGSKYSVTCPVCNKNTGIRGKYYKKRVIEKMIVE